MKGFIATYFSFTKKERAGITAAVILIVLVTILPFFYPLLKEQKSLNSSQFEKEIALLKMQESEERKPFSAKSFKYDDDQTESEHFSSRQTSTFSGQMFPFDPNTLSVEGWQKLGIKDKTIQTIQKYLSKGGRFYKPEDIGKIWGLHPNEINRLLPFIQIAQNDKKSFDNHLFSNNKYEKAPYIPSLTDINTADTIALIGLPGIGSKLAQRIVNFREKLGGFYSIEQVGETFGLADSTYQKIKNRLTILNTTVRQININTASVDQLKIHPYLRFNVANAIIQYRSQHGDFSTVEDLRKVMLITEDIFKKVRPYLKISDK